MSAREELAWHYLTDHVFVQTQFVEAATSAHAAAKQIVTKMLQSGAWHLTRLPLLFVAQMTRTPLGSLTLRD